MNIIRPAILLSGLACVGICEGAVEGFSFPMLTLYHCTSEAAARQILAVDFRDHMDRYLTDREWTGVWLSDRPMNNTEGASGDTVLQIEIADEILTPYEWVEEGKSYREWIVPAAVLNKDGRVTLAKLG